MNTIPLFRGLTLAVLMLTGCGSTPDIARVKGQLQDNGQNYELPAGAGEVFIVFNLLDADGKPVPFKMYTSMVKTDGSFEVINSAGELPVGTYQVGIDASAAKFPKAKPFALPDSLGRATFKAGPNMINFDLAKPTG